MQTTPPPSPWQAGMPYERYVGRWSRLVAPRFLTWLGVPPGQRWLDVGCGTGALCEAIVTQCAPASVTGLEPAEGFLSVARQKLPPDVALVTGSAAAMPLADASFDVVVAGLVLNFVPDLGAALAEIQRVAKPGASIGAYVWDYSGKMDLMRYFWNAAWELDADVAKLVEASRFPLCHPDALIQAMNDAGLQAAEVTAIDIATPFADFDDYWQPFLGGTGPAPAYATGLAESAREKLKARLQSQLPIQADGSIPLEARAWAVRATV